MTHGKTHNHWGVFGAVKGRVGIGWVSQCNHDGWLEQTGGVGLQMHTDIVFEEREDAERYITLRVLAGEGVGT